MKKNFYLLTLLLFLLGSAFGQDCSSLQISYSATESRCVATGSITVNVTGGSGNFNYQVSGALSTPLTSSNHITGLKAGTYTITVKDLTNGCTKQLANAYVPGTYQDPRFQLVKTDPGCSGNNGTIAVTNQQFGRGPFLYTIVSPSPSSVGVSNTSGSFSGLTPGEYTIRLQDSCGSTLR